jgi:hypothetical protein
MNTAAEKLQIARINRKLAKWDEKLRTSRGWSEYINLGRLHVIELRRNFVVNRNVTDPRISKRNWRQRNKPG